MASFTFFLLLCTLHCIFGQLDTPTTTETIAQATASLLVSEGHSNKDNFSTMIVIIIGILSATFCFLGFIFLWLLYSAYKRYKKLTIFNGQKRIEKFQSVSALDPSSCENISHTHSLENMNAEIYGDIENVLNEELYADNDEKEAENNKANIYEQVMHILDKDIVEPGMCNKELEDDEYSHLTVTSNDDDDDADIGGTGAGIGECSHSECTSDAQCYVD